MRKLFIVSNRLPVKAVKEDGRYILTPSEGGLATGLRSLDIPHETHWVGWCGVSPDTVEEQQPIREQLEAQNFHPIFLTNQQIENYYEGYSNSTIWPLCHYFFSYTQYKSAYWETYKEVNRIFADEVAKLIGPDDIIWVQDYQLMLVPGMLRAEKQDASIGYFHHIPFPSYELFRILPERAEILKGLLGADFVAFHTADYMRHFISACQRVLRPDSNLDEIRMGRRITRINALPMGINYDLFHDAPTNPLVQEQIAAMRSKFGNHKLILSVDRLDYSKGILHRLRGFNAFLEQYPQYRGKVSLAMIIVPSRDQVESYADLKTKIDETIGAINGQYSTMEWSPVYYFYHAFSFEELIALYNMADIALITPLRDGMNLVAKEYVAAQRDNNGVLILSEMAGAAAELTDAVIVNPNDADEISRAIYTALRMSKSERKTRMKNMQHIVSHQTVNKWANDFIKDLMDIHSRNQKLERRVITDKDLTEIKQNCAKAKKRLFILDYDGTLVGFKKRPQDARPTKELLNILSTLASDPKNLVVINSGRDNKTLDKWLGGLPVMLIAEHGAFYKEKGKWHRNTQPIKWDPDLLKTIKRFTDSTAGSKMEKKETALVWHYRAADSWLGEIRRQQLINTLVVPCSRQQMQIMPGNKIVEIKPSNINKGVEISKLMQQDYYDFIFAIGDDTTDEDMFLALPSGAVTVKVGSVSENARYSLLSQSDVLPLIKNLI